jgi:hypothetical protein
MNKRLIFLLSLLLPLAASGAELRTFYVIPVAAHTSGANGTAWRSDVTIQNPGTTTLTIDISAVKSGEGLTDNIVPVSSGIAVPAGGVVALSDVLNGTAAGEVIPSAALLIGSDKPFAVTSRTYNSTANGTYGQTVSPASDIATAGSTIYIPGIIANARFRTNIGLLMVANTPMTVGVALTDEGGETRGQRIMNVAAGSATHVQFGTAAVASRTFDSAGAVVRIVHGDGSVIAYASVVDNITGDASFITGGVDIARPVEPLSLLLLRR